MKIRVLGAPMHSAASVTEACGEVVNFRVIQGVDKFLLHAQAHQKQGYQYLVIDSLATLNSMGIPLLGVRILSPMRTLRHPLVFPKRFPELELKSKILGVKLAIGNAKRLAKIKVE